MSKHKRISIKLTAEQRAALQRVAGLDGEAIELEVEELEERIAPSRLPIAGEAGDTGHRDWIELL